MKKQEIKSQKRLIGEDERRQEIPEGSPEKRPSVEWSLVIYL